jgi:hypothetical protein
MASAPKTFGTCCERLGLAMANPADTDEDDDEALQPLIGVGEDGVLYMAVQLDASDPDEIGTADHPIYFCPFCGTKLQTPEEVDSKAAASAATH